MPALRRSHRAGAAAIGCLFLVLLVTGCGDGGGGEESDPTAETTAATTAATSTPPTTATATADAEERITIRDFAFTPPTLTVSPGATVTVVNQDSASHTVTATDGESFDTGEIAGGRSATFTAPDTPGTYPFFCSIHPRMTGTLTVA
ncbi:cupredoxin domain-containing protein [Streptomyces sp. MUM 178J]|uniref:cupredoxin domain-containing protein n=1 Tax=Streptomyces sp. MUM 178J TaxID=2791991 RepID=UPI001F048883|nr:cupredoxin domain-containing protein [Streptomyces sp. MUM 178J]WRQ78258.1 cupredoxin domain-containing protein [Streptomyces sp. MUM 178J]